MFWNVRAMPWVAAWCGRMRLRGTPSKGAPGGTPGSNPGSNLGSALGTLLLMALVVGSRLCAYYAAELGTMKVTEQLDAMNIMAIDPVQYLAMPRFWASVLMIPVVTIFCDLIAILGGYIASVATLDVSSGVFIEGLQMFYKHSDLLGGLIKSFFFGAIISLSGIYFGFNTTGGAEGVGRSTMTAVVGSCLSVLVADYLLAIVLFQIIFEKG